MNVTLTGATGLIGAAIVRRLLERGDAVTVLSRDPDRARAALGDVEAHAWRPLQEPAPAAALSGREAVVHLAGENVAQRWTDDVAPRDPRLARDRHAQPRRGHRLPPSPRPRVLVSASAVGYYGPRGDEPVTEDAAARRRLPGPGLRRVGARGRPRRRARAAGGHAAHGRGARPAGRRAGEDAALLPPRHRRPVAGGRQYLPWIHADDIVGLYLAALDDASWEGPINACAPEPVTNRDFSRALGRALHRPAFAPVPGLAVRAALRRHGRDRHHRPARRAHARARARLRLPPHRPRAGPARRSRLRRRLAR